jgi:poly(A) polymerase
MTEKAPPQRSEHRSEREDALAVVRRLRDAGHVAYFAGGCVRDELMGLAPKDYDAATDAPPQRVRELFSNTQAVGAAFGVILVRHRGTQIEVATFRADDSYVDGRRPTGVKFTTAEEDAKRRDFTINGLFLDPVENRVIDYVGGQRDIEARVIRAIGDPDHRFEEDHLRLLRAVRFAARFGFEIEPTTAEAIRRHADRLKRISPERVADELRAMIGTPTRGAAWEMLWGFGLTPVIFRTLPQPAEPPVGFNFHDKDSAPLFPSLAAGEPVPFPLALAALVLDYRGNVEGGDVRTLLETPEVQRAVQTCRTTLKISNDESDFMAGVLHLGPLLRDDPPTVATMKRFLATPTSKWSRVLLDALLLRHSTLTRIPWLRQQFALLEREDVAPAPLVTGDDLTAAGIKPGPVFKRVLDAVYDAQLEARVGSKEQALAMGLELAKRA